MELGFDGLDINLGCPVKAFHKKGGRRGAGLIKEYKLVEKIVLDVRKAIKDMKAVIGLSVKTRTGIKTHDTKEWIGFLADLPIDAIILHGRTFRQSYSGKANWEEIAQGAQIAKKQGRVFLGNGDIKNREEAQRFSLQYHTDGALIGRAARGNPWAFSKPSDSMIRIIRTKQERINTLLKHARYFEKTRGKRRFIEFRKHLGWYLKGFSGAKNTRARLIMVKTLEELEQGLAKYA